MEDKKYLNEEEYQKVVKKLSRISIIILVFGLLIGGGLIGYGFIKSNEVNKPVVEEQEKNESDTQAEINALEEELAELEAKKIEEFTTNGHSEEYFRLNNQIEEKNIKLGGLRIGELGSSVIFKPIKDEADEVKNKVKTAPYFMTGGFVIFASIVLALMFFLFAKRRQITAFSVQQSMPVTKEGLEEMAPTLGEVGKEIAKGIKEGTKGE
ncbi:MAG TPA: hypothetical protein PLG47_00865 [Candidatus Dojkabacteria bacterium]|nr:hypothetical protein [Candidatus Dojkabacteria bacterium]